MKKAPFFIAPFFIIIAALVFAPATAVAEPHPMNANAIAAQQSGEPETMADHGSGVIIDNGTVQLGVNPLGNLDVPGGTPSWDTRRTTVGLRYMPTNADATAPGCECEGWGVADNISKVTGYANNASGTSNNLTVETWEHTASTAKSVVLVGETFRITHNYRPSASPNLYEVIVTIENISSSAVEVLYRRVFDFDVEPTAFDEYITINSAGSPAIIFTSNHGFASANPLNGPSGAVTGDFVDEGPYDHGALFDFNFGELAPGASITFSTFYGAAADENGAEAALATVRAEAFSLGQPSKVSPEPDAAASDPKVGNPNTFIFAFAGVGGRVFSVDDYYGVALLDDINGNGSQDIAGLTTLKNGAPVVVFKDSRTKVQIKWLAFFNANFEPIAIDSNGINVVVLVRNRSNGTIWAQARNAQTGKVLWSVASVPFPLFK